MRFLSGLLGRGAMLPAMLLTLVLSVAAHAQSGGGAGYFYPSSGVCATGCFGVRASFEAPNPTYVGTNGEFEDGSSIWVGVWSAPNAHETSCAFNQGAPGSPSLLQFGINPIILSTGAISYQPWWEAYQCNFVQNYSTLTINPGDKITIELLCVANCTAGNQNANWQMTWTNLTTGAPPLVRNDTGNWRVWPDHAQFSIEMQQIGGVNGTTAQPLHFAKPMRVSNVQVYQNGAWGPMSVPGESPAGRLQNDKKQIRCTPTPPSSCGTLSSIMHFYSVSPTVDSDLGPSYIITSTVMPAATNTAFPVSPYGPYTGTNGVGP
jgi:hypothetical protein